MTSRICRLGLFFAMCVAMGMSARLNGKEIAAKGYSHVRIVRLSFVNGPVLVKRAGSTQWAKALVNTPVEQGFTISTGGGGFAEVEFENGSTARLGENSKLRFDELALTPKGATVNHLRFTGGYATFHVIPKHGDEYTVTTGNTVITPRGKAEFRTDLRASGLMRVEVFDGAVEVKGPKGATKLTKNKVLRYDDKTLSAFDVSKGIEKDSWDNWVHKRDQEAELAYNDSPIGMNNSLYGWGDLDEYGEWAYFPGSGYGWSPFEPAGWTPFSMGMWSWYPSLGYTWISAEPWGWLPFHTGLWNYDPGFGYFWMPGNLSMWYPAMVDWYTGPGYVGWAPMGIGGAPACASTNCVVAVKPGVVQGGALVDQNTRVNLTGAHLTPVHELNLAPTPRAMLSGTPIVARTAAFRGMPATTAPHAFVRAGINPGAVAARAPRVAAAAPAFRSVAAPRVVLMGQSTSQARAELRGAQHASLFTRAFEANHHGLMRARLGNTLGGQFAVKAAGREGMGFEPAGAPMVVRRAMAGNTAIRTGQVGMEAHPVFLSHRMAPGFVGRQPGMDRLPMGNPAASMRANGAIRSGAPMGSYHVTGPTVRGFNGPSPSMGGFHGVGRMGGGMRAPGGMSAPHAAARGAAGGAHR